MIDPNERMSSVELVPYNSQWVATYAVAADEIKSILQENCVEIHHIGSTAIPNIFAKPIIDILVVVKDIKTIDLLNNKFEMLGYVCMGEYGISGRRFYWKSKTIRTHNIHLFEQGAPEILRHLSFRDFLRADNSYAQVYSLVKQRLADSFPNDIEGYVNGKSSFVQMISYKTNTASALQLSAQDDIVIEPYNPDWIKLAEAEIKVIRSLANKLPYVSIKHCGSTSVPNLSSKPIIDICIELESIKEADRWVKPLEILGYVLWNENSDKTHLQLFKGMPPFGMKRTHHIHIVESANG